MKRIGQLLIAIGFLEGSLVSVLHETEVPWLYLALGLAVGVVGEVLPRQLDGGVDQERAEDVEHPRPGLDRLGAYGRSGRMLPRKSREHHQGPVRVGSGPT